MLIHFDMSEHEPVVTHRTCEYHKRNPEDRSWPGCTCMSVFAMRRKETTVRAPRRLRKRGV